MATDGNYFISKYPSTLCRSFPKLSRFLGINSKNSIILTKIILYFIMIKQYRRKFSLNLMHLQWNGDPRRLELNKLKANNCQRVWMSVNISSFKEISFIFI